MKSIYSSLPNDLIIKIIRESTVLNNIDYWEREIPSQHIDLQNKINNFLTRISFIVLDFDCYNSPSEILTNLGISTTEPIFSSELILNTMSTKYRKIMYHIYSPLM